MSRSPEKVTLRLRRSLIRMAEFQDGLCFHCSEPVILPELHRQYERDEGNSPRDASREHLIPRSTGGMHGGNVVVACRECNSKRGSERPTDEELDRLVALNEKRGIAAVPFCYPRDTIDDPSPASDALLNLLVKQTGPAGVKLRRNVFRHTSKAMTALQRVDTLENFGTWEYLVALVRKDFQVRATKLPKPFGDLCDSIIITHINRVRRRILKTYKPHKNIGDTEAQTRAARRRAALIQDTTVT